MQRNPLFPKSQTNIISDPTLAYQKLCRVIRATKFYEVEKFYLDFSSHAIAEFFLAWVTKVPELKESFTNTVIVPIGGNGFVIPLSARQFIDLNKLNPVPPSLPADLSQIKLHYHWSNALLDGIHGTSFSTQLPAKANVVSEVKSKPSAFPVKKLSFEDIQKKIADANATILQELQSNKFWLRLNTQDKSLRIHSLAKSFLDLIDKAETKKMSPTDAFVEIQKLADEAIAKKAMLDFSFEETIEFCRKLLSKLEESQQVYSEIVNHGKQIAMAQSPGRNIR